MRILIGGLLILFALVVPAKAQTKPCSDVSWFQHLEATGPVEIVPGKTDQRVYPCGFVLAQKGNTLDFQMWVAPMGTCDVGPTQSGNVLTPKMSLPTDVQLVNRIENVGPVAPAGYSLCIQTFGSGALTGAIYWAQF